MSSDSDFLESSSFEDSEFEETLDLEFKSIDSSSVVAEIKHLVKRLSDFSELSIDVCEALLVKYNWDLDLIFSHLIDDPAACAVKLGLKDLNSVGLLDLYPPTKQRFKCPVCLESKPKFGLKCEHFVCEECFSLHVLYNGINIQQFATCPGSQDCHLIVLKPIINALGHSQLYDSQILNLYINQKPDTKWCPAPDCGLLVQTKNTEINQVFCRNNHTFCFKCSKIVDHLTLPCDLVSNWLAHANHDTQSQQWLKENTKQCPKCQALIQRQEGCNHMHCLSCTYQFCWICSQSWADHSGNSYYNCFKQQIKPESKSKSSKKISEKNRFYLQRFDQHFFFANNLENGKLKYAHNALAWSYVYLCCAINTNATLILTSLVDDLELALDADEKDLNFKTQRIIEHFQAPDFNLKYEFLE